MKEKLLALQKQEQERVVQETTAAMEEAKQVIKTTEQEVQIEPAFSAVTIKLSMPADLSIDLNKRKMIRKMKRERYFVKLTAMIKTIKKRSDSDMITEAKQDLDTIDRQIATIPAEKVNDMTIEARNYTALEIPLPKRFNPSKFAEWDHEFLQSVPQPEQDNSSQLRTTGLRQSKYSQSNFARFLCANQEKLEKTKLD